MRRTKQEAEETRRKLLKAALQVICDKGYTAVTLTDVAERVGMTRGAIYWHFGSKNELIQALFKDRIDPFFKLFDEVMEKPGRAISKLEEIMMIFIEKLKKDNEFIQNQNLDFLFFQVRTNIPEIVEYERKHASALLKKINKLIIQGIDEGDIQPVAPVIISGLISVVFTGLADVYVKKKARFLMIEKPEDFVELLFNGIRVSC